MTKVTVGTQFSTLLKKQVIRPNYGNDDENKFFGSNFLNFDVFNFDTLRTLAGFNIFITVDQKLTNPIKMYSQKTIEKLQFSKRF